MADYVLPSPFLAPWTTPGRLPRSAEAPALAGVLAGWADRAGAGTGAVVFLEATPRLGLAVGLRLGRAGWAVAPLYGRWPAPRAVLPAERLTGWLVGVAGALDATGATPLAGRLCLLLDAERARPVAGPTLRRRFDNRYDYPAYLLPPPARLLAWDTGCALWAGPAAAVPPDLQDYAESLVRAGITLDLVPLRAPDT